MPELPQSTRRVPKATYVPVNVPVDPLVFTVGRAVQKYNFVRQLNLQPGEVSAVLAASVSAASTNVSAIAALSRELTVFEGAPLPAQLPGRDFFASTPIADLLAFGRALSALRSDRWNQLVASPAPSAATTPAPAGGPNPLTTAAAPSTATVTALAGPPAAVPGPQRNQLKSSSGRPTAAATTTVDPKALAVHLLNTSLNATNSLDQNASATPIGMLNLERLEMTPAGVEQGELIATIPLAPLEQTAVVQKEWSVTTKEFTSIVTDSLENYSETGVTDNTELAQSTTSQISHNNQFNVNATASGGVNFLTIANAQSQASTGFTAQDQNSTSATASVKHATTTTKKASSRSKQEHKVTISTTSVTGTSETSTRNLQNPSPTDPMRIDYFSLMRKWQVGLYRYGLRLTYDIVIPEPGGLLREIYAQLAVLQIQASAAFSFNLPYSAITPGTYQSLAAQYGAQIPPPPVPQGPLTIDSGAIALDQNVGNVTIWSTPAISIPDGQCVDHIEVSAYIGNNTGGPDGKGFRFVIVGFSPNELGFQDGGRGPVVFADLTWFLSGATGSIVITSTFRWANPATVTFLIHLKPTDDANSQWQATSWSTLYNAAQTAFYANQQQISSQIQALQAKLTNVDTLTLRREENDEIMKGVLQWLLGPGFDFMPDEVVAILFQQALPISNFVWGINFPGSQLFTGTNVSGSVSEWNTVATYEQTVRFINDALDWDNIVYFLYSYFWDVPFAWDNIRNIQHPDATRQAFLRAGSARVVLTVREGWETAWVNFVEGGNYGLNTLPLDHPYLTIAQEIQDYDNTNYPGIPPANPGGDAAPDDSVYVATSSIGTDTGGKVGPSAGQVTLTVVSSANFVVGQIAIIDSWQPYAAGSTTQAVQEQQPITAVPDKTHITVAKLLNPHGGSGVSFPVIQAGEKGQLIAEWFEYTPTSGTDIAVTSNLATIA